MAASRVVLGDLLYGGENSASFVISTVCFGVVVDVVLRCASCERFVTDGVIGSACCCLRCSTVLACAEGTHRVVRMFR